MKNYLNKFKLNGKIALVIGGAGTIGQEVCKAFATAGAKTIIVDKNEYIKACQVWCDNSIIWTSAFRFQE